MNNPAPNSFDALHKKLSEQQESARQEWLLAEYNIRQELLATVLPLWRHYFPTKALAEMHMGKSPDARLIIRAAYDDAEAPLFSISLCSNLHFTITLYADGRLRNSSAQYLLAGANNGRTSTTEQLVVLALFFEQLQKKLSTAPDYINLHALAEKTLREARGIDPLFPRNVQDVLAAEKLVASLAIAAPPQKAHDNLRAAKKLMRQKTATP